MFKLTVAVLLLAASASALDLDVDVKANVKVNVLSDDHKASECHQSWCKKQVKAHPSPRPSPWCKHCKPGTKPPVSKKPSPQPSPWCKHCKPAPKPSPKPSPWCEHCKPTPKPPVSSKPSPWCQHCKPVTSTKPSPAPKPWNCPTCDKHTTKGGSTKPSGPKPPVKAGLADIDKAVLNFALNLEYLEAQFYSCAAFGKALPASLTGPKAGDLSGCKKADLSDEAFGYAATIAIDEIAHVALIRTVLGAEAVSMPAINIGSAFVAAADAAATLAGAIKKGESIKFDAYGNDILFYHAAFIFEDVGVTAYKGAATLLKSSVVLEAAAGILAVEAYHGGAIRTLLYEVPASVKPFGLPVPAIVKAISNLRGAVGGGKDQGLVKTVKDADNKNTDVPILAPGDGNAVAFSRSYKEVLKIVYLGGTEKGGFFPNGLNGALTKA